MNSRVALSDLRNLFSVSRDDKELIFAQYFAFSRQIPVLYFILLTNTWMLAVSFFGTAPSLLSFYFPAALTIFCAFRLALWARSKHLRPTQENAFKALVRTNRLAVLLSIAFSLWSIALFPYGDAFGQAHIAFYMAITVIGCIFCLMHLRSASLTVAIIVNVFFVAFFGFSGNATFEALAGNVALVTMAMLFILFVHYNQFKAMIAAREEAQSLIRENARLANIDPLTGLPNRRQFFKRLEQEFARAQKANIKLAVGVIDLDGFKPVNDLYGHAAGDVLLLEVGRRLHEASGEGFHLARIGGDEFAVIALDFASEQDLLDGGDRMCEALRLPFFLPEATVQISGSIGFAIYPELATTAMSLFERADYALYRSKRQQRGGAVLFSKEDCQEILRDAEIEQSLYAADLEKELSVSYQPIVDIATNATLAFEALARWQSPLLGAMNPSDFIPAAERMGIINKVTRVLLEKALVTACQWPENIRLSFNLSAKDISTTEGTVRLVATILKSGFDPKRIDFEITETAVLGDFAKARETFDILRTLGCGICLDDFGTGYSSLTQLHSLPLTKIKIDRSFVIDLHLRPSSYKIVKSLLTLSRDMGLGCVVEGVQKNEELMALQDLGCRKVQGYLFSRPLPAQAASAFLSLNSSDHRSEAPPHTFFHLN